MSKAAPSIPHVLKHFDSFSEGFAVLVYLVLNLFWELCELVWASAGGSSLRLDNLCFIEALLLPELVFLNVHAPVAAIVFSVGVLVADVGPDWLGVGAVQVVGLGFPVHEPIQAPLFRIDPLYFLDAAFIELLNSCLVLAIARLLLVQLCVELLDAGLSPVYCAN